MSRETNLQEHLCFVRECSPYYGDAWSAAWKRGGTAPPLGELPITDHVDYWEANTPQNNRLLTVPHTDGVVFKSGGTTGNPKFSFFSNEDWFLFCRQFGQGLRRGGLSAGERVANIFYGGQLYASLLFVGRCIEEAGVGVNFPIAGFASPEEIIANVKEFGISTVAGVPTTIMNLIPLLEAEKGKLTVTQFLYGGEAMYPDQVAALQRAVPGCRVRSIGIAGVDYGEMGWVDASCEPGVHRTFDDSTVLELLDEEGRSLDDAGAEGALYITNFQRKLMPIVRYPVGDRGRWADPPGTPGRRFKVLGRTEKGARIGPVTFYMEDMQRVLSGAAGETGFVAFQLVVDHEDRRDRCTVRVAVPNPTDVPKEMSTAVIDALYKERPLFPESIEKGAVHSPVVEWVTPGELLTNPRTGKLMRLIDRRFS
ncbi:phenylacetate-CoA ligase [Desulfonatronum thiosulfatophilum]|uniref:Phenylacetate-CoA ligase n=1 Tax=Desulfonatronum thiosulfatophilum TaxID=617002 RepID=A0A1G6BEB2_9BACT|nr:phenylacetate--CoA ligase family protein [Desulfonatronum thiosulfatophilum]SDB18889.1 phenylacetate-CoA ligase [Desulfonatronum thiosulfatophilum]